MTGYHYVVIFVLQPRRAWIAVQMTVSDEDSQTSERACSVKRQIQSQVRPLPSVVTVSLDGDEKEISASYNRRNNTVSDVQISCIKEAEAVFVSGFFRQQFECLVVTVDIACDNQKFIFFYSYHCMNLSYHNRLLFNSIHMLRKKDVFPYNRHIFSFLFTILRLQMQFQS